MPSELDTSITSNIQPISKVENKTMKTTENTEPISSDIIDNDTLPKSQVKGRSKRPMSTSPPAPPNKRLNMESSTSATQKQHRAYNDLPSDWLDDLTSTAESNDTSTKTLQFTYHTGDMFDSAPPNCLLIHACNTQGHWGAGIAKAFKTFYPKAYLAHHKFCTKEHDKTTPVPTGTAQLLAPVDGDTQHWIGCLFTSAKYGKAKDKPDAIVRHTVGAMKTLLELVRLAGDEVGEIRMCKINSGKFGVPWEKTEEALRGIALQEGWRGAIEVWEP